MARLFVSRGRCAGDVIIIEVNRPPRNEVMADSTGGQNGIANGSSLGEVDPCLDGCEAGDFDDATGRRRGRRDDDEDFVYVELDVDCASARRQNHISTSK